MMRSIVGGLLALSVAQTASAQHYTMRMRSILGPDGTVAFGCISQPYVAAAADYAAGRAFTPAVRAFYEATRRDVTVPYMTEGTSFGGLGSSRVPLDPGLDEAILAQVDAAIGNCTVPR